MSNQWTREPMDFSRPVANSLGIPRAIEGEVLITPYNDIETASAIVEKYADELAGVIVEPMQRTIPPKPGFLQELRKLTAHFEIPLIFNEVVTGFRLGYGGAQKYYGVAPNLCALGKSISGGHPMAVLCGRAEIMETAQAMRRITGGYVSLTGSFSGNPISCATAGSSKPTRSSSFPWHTPMKTSIAPSRPSARRSIPSLTEIRRLWAETLVFPLLIIDRSELFLLTRILAFGSGVPALIYQVVWTREIALLVGNQVEAISVVLVAFFGGLALGARVLGGLVDRAVSPLRCYGVFEVTAGLLAIISIPSLRGLGETLTSAESTHLTSVSAALMIFPTTLLLGGTIPALLRSSVRDLSTAAYHAGGLTGANTAGSVLGVCLAVLLIPTRGLATTMMGAGSMAIAIGIVAFALSRGRPRPTLAPFPASDAMQFPSRPVLYAAALAGVATLAYEVLAARMAAMLLGSSLYAWGAVLATTLLGLASGNLALAGRAARTATPHRDLGQIEIAAAISIGLGLLVFAPSPVTPAEGVTAASLLAVGLGVLPAAFSMGGAFPFFVRLAATRPDLGHAFGTVSAVNTAGGIVGAMLAPFALLPTLGPVGGALACAGLNATLGTGFLFVGTSGRRRLFEIGGAIAALLVAFVAAGRSSELPPKPRAIYLAHGRQATAVVLSYGERRDLLVDGDVEASTVGDARSTEEFLAVLPLLLHPHPERFLEVGLGSGITMGTAARFPLQRIECVEIAASVLGAARFFAPDNRDITSGLDDRIQIVHADGRAHLLRRRGEFDIVVANTLHPWSVGATGLYSREYFIRLADALRPGGIAAQWLPLGVLGEKHLAVILRSFFGAFEYGELYWGANNLMLIGSNAPIADVPAKRFAKLQPFAPETFQRLGIQDVHALAERRMANGAQVLQLLGPGEILTDDRPILEARTFERIEAGAAKTEAELLVRIVRSAADAEPGRGAMLLWIEARAARASGNIDRAAQLESVAEGAGFELAYKARLERTLAEADRQNRAQHVDEAITELNAIIAEAPDQADVWLTLARIEFQRDRFDAAHTAVERAVALEPARGEAWNLLGVLKWRNKDLEGAWSAFTKALTAAPYLPEALGNAGLLSLARGDRQSALQILERLEELHAAGPLKEEQTLRRAIEAKH